MNDAAVNASALRRLGFSEGLIAHLEKHDLDAPLGYRCQPPLYWRHSDLAARDIVPLWECGMVLVYFNVRAGAFEQCSLEAPDDVWWSLTSVQAVLADLFIDLMEDGLEDDVLRATAARVGFQHLPRLLEEAAAHDGRDWWGWRETFPQHVAD